MSVKLKVLLRQVDEVPARKWLQVLDFERRCDEAEAAAGHPLPRRYRAMYGREHTQLRVSERIYDSFAGLGRLTEEAFRNEQLQRLAAEGQRLLNWRKRELYYVDSGSPVPRWMQAISRKSFDPASLSSAVGYYDFTPKSREEVEENIKAGKLRVMYRLIQEIPKDRWAEKLEQERLSDAAEAAAGHPLPLRYRSMYGTENSHIRINEREYDSFYDFCVGTERFLADNDPENKAIMDAEVRRQDFFIWEREELYIVDSDSFVPQWMHFAAEE